MTIDDETSKMHHKFTITKFMIIDDKTSNIHRKY